LQNESKERKIVELEKKIAEMQKNFQVQKKKI